MSTFYTIDQITQYIAEKEHVTLKETLNMSINWSETDEEMANLDYMEIEVEVEEYIPEENRMEEEPIQF